MAIKLLDYHYYSCLLLLLVSLLSLHICSGLMSDHLHHHHYHHHHQVPIPILSLPLKKFPSYLNKSHLFSHFRVFLKSRFCLPQNLTPDDEDRECTDDPCDSSPTSPSPLRKLLGHNIQIPKSASTANTFTCMPVSTVSSLNLTATSAPPITSLPTDLGRTWCVARPVASETALQNALDYACGIGGADCTAIQYMRSCYNPNTVHAHASYAFNSFYQKYPVPSSCDFRAVAMLVNVNPSSSNCTYPSSSVSSYYPLERGEGSVSGIPESDSDYSGSTSTLGSHNLLTSSSNCSAISGSAAPLIFAFTLAYIRGRI
ncbi:hypothetical protein LUZ62_064049 [Rhynchospora pubera]|uniref:X8 domain-containing protein n=1 Tax=Rhynchospora pubera TaxID=906938 RepID=A0AAV8ENV8_9POAL|nr:hypothetical protein LUZ62_064049 [Rhynchospora pubera]